MSSDRLLMLPDQALRFACHEAGHAIVAWSGPQQGEFCAEMPTIGTRRGSVSWGVPEDPGLRMMAWLAEFTRIWDPARKNHDLWEHCALVLGGLAGEGVGMKVVRTAGADADLESALRIAEYLAGAAVPAEHPWADGVSDVTKIDVCRMFADPLAPAVAAVLNACYRHARFIIKREEPRFHKLVITLIRDWKVDHRGLEEILGARR